MFELIFYSLIGGLFSLFGGLLVLWKEKMANRIILPLISFGAGAFLAAAFLDFLPEALENSIEPHPILLSTLIGFVLFFILERLLMRFFHISHTKGKHFDHTESLPLLLILGDSIHNFLDGILIAIAYIANPVLGLSTSLAIAAHEIPQEIGDFSILLNLGWKRGKIIAVNIMQSLLTIPGVILGYQLGQNIEPYLAYFMGGAAGIFIYLAATDLIPEMHHRSEHKYFFRVILPFISSIIFIYLVINLTHS